MLAKYLIVMMFVSTVSLVVIINLTTPNTAGALGILSIFVVTYTLALSVLTFFMYGISRIIVKLSQTIVVRKPLQSLTLKRAYYYSSVIALSPIILISMQSVGTLGVYEFGLVLFFVVVGCIYVTKRTA